MNAVSASVLSHRPSLSTQASTPFDMTRSPRKRPNCRCMLPSRLIKGRRPGRRFARAGQITYYGALGAAVGKHARWPLWTQILDGISDDEQAKGNPDITDLVLSAKTGWPSRISRQFTDGKPTDEQKQKAQRGLDEVFRHYCAGKQAPKLPRPK
jgi:hypothetical protein